MPKLENGFVKGILKHTIQERQDHHSVISYSQFSMFNKCPLSWKLRYIDKHRDDLPGIAVLFGTAFHETLQSYLYEIFEGAGPGAADKMDLRGMLQQNMADEYVRLMEQTGGEIFTSKQEMEEHYADGVAILDYIRKKRNVYFGRKHTELVAIEMPLYMPVTDTNKNVFITGFVDVILYDTFKNKYIIIDIKTSTNGWNKYMKADKTKTSQLLLYKKYFASQIGCDEKQIDVKYFIVRRKIPEESMFPIKRVSEFSPASGKPSVNKVMTDVNSFVNIAFNADGSYNTEHNYLAIGGKGLKNCRWCPYANNETLCPKSNRIKE